MTLCEGRKRANDGYEEALWARRKEVGLSLKILACLRACF
jgi:hypothetical protein